MVKIFSGKLICRTCKTSDKISTDDQTKFIENGKVGTGEPVLLKVDLSCYSIYFSERDQFQSFTGNN